MQGERSDRARVHRTIKFLEIEGKQSKMAATSTEGGKDFRHKIEVGKLERDFLFGLLAT